MLPILRSPLVRCISAFIFACTLLPSLRAQSTEADIKAKLKGQPLYLREFWREDDLHFDSTGQLISKSGTVTFTICGFDLKAMKLKPDKLILEGSRVGLELKDNQQKRVPLEYHVHIEIEASPSGDYGPALDTIFVEGLDKLVPSLPPYWQSYAEKNFLQASVTNSDSKSKETKAQITGSAVSRPKLISSVEPMFNSVAKSKGYAGSVLINFWVEPDGTISHLSLRKALGLGMDEDALAAVQRYTFTPAMENSKPIRFELNVETSFSLH